MLSLSKLMKPNEVFPMQFNVISLHLFAFAFARFGNQSGITSQVQQVTK